MGSYAPSGSQWMYVDSATTVYPTGNGATTGTDTSSLLASAAATTIYGVMVTAAAADNIVLQNHAGTALTGHTIAIGSGQAVPYFVPLGGPRGLHVAGGISAKRGGATALKFNVYFDRTQ